MSLLPMNVRAAILRFETASVQLARKDQAHPDDQHAIIHQHERARESLVRAIEKVINK